MIFSVTYRETFEEATSVQEHITTFEAPSKAEALGTITGWMNHCSHRGGIIQVLQIDVGDAQEASIGLAEAKKLV